jgi:hypothetical protein
LANFNEWDPFEGRIRSNFCSFHNAKIKKLRCRMCGKRRRTSLFLLGFVFDRLWICKVFPCWDAMEIEWATQFLMYGGLRGVDGVLGGWLCITCSSTGALEAWNNNLKTLVERRHSLSVSHPRVDIERN